MALRNLSVFEKDPADSISKQFTLQIDDLDQISTIVPYVYVATMEGRKDQRTWEISGNNLASSNLAYTYDNSGTYPTISWRFYGGDAGTYYAIYFNINNAATDDARYQPACIVKKVDLITYDS